MFFLKRSLACFLIRLVSWATGLHKRELIRVTGRAGLEPPLTYCSTANLIINIELKDSVEMVCVVMRMCVKDTQGSGEPDQHGGRPSSHPRGSAGAGQDDRRGLGQEVRGGGYRVGAGHRAVALSSRLGHSLSVCLSDVDKSTTARLMSKW